MVWSSGKHFFRKNFDTLFTGTVYKLSFSLVIGQKELVLMFESFFAIEICKLTLLLWGNEMGAKIMNSKRMKQKYFHIHIVWKARASTLKWMQLSHE